ncbi:pyridoxal phosphate-dependent aminotransferase [Parvibium lacunae]|uniref:Aminotransferase n=1 Tax=Parvibium lacunae TaxID=1888893 RepID=A0A368L1P3_9BURK|nr:pyridoxal phosphate-dependent aminotransferase [Parvibium lacunae]RCS57479.1 pyridoxal phosphate-dependent aminotransferase [Parvibium lacunae]
MSHSLIAKKLEQIAPFHVMEVMKAADELATQGQDIIHLSVGEPDFTAAPAVVTALQQALLQAGQGDATALRYSNALGRADLRRAIAQFYQARYQLAIAPERIVVTAGASAALLLVLNALLDPDDQVLMPDPCYPCNRHFVVAAGGKPQLVPCGPEQRYQLTAHDVAAHWQANTKGVLLASPSNPTGTSIAPDELARMVEVVRSKGGFTIVDEIYGGLVYDHAPHTALHLGEDVIVVNSFSKYFNMTGWRLGWLVLPQALVPAVEKLAQNLFICPPAPAQAAALACFAPESLALFEERRQAFKERRDYLVPALEALGLKIPVQPDGAFYVYADCSALSSNSEQFVMDVLRATGVCMVPGKDFGFAAPERYVRISFATALPRLQEAVGRLQKHLAMR